MIRHWNRFSERLWGVMSLETFKIQPDTVLSRNEEPVALMRTSIKAAFLKVQPKIFKKSNNSREMIQE